MVPTSRRAPPTRIVPRSRGARRWRPLRRLVLLLVLSALEAPLPAQEADPRRAALASLRPGERIRVQSVTAGRVEGRLAGMSGDVLYARVEGRDLTIELGGIEAVWSYRDRSRPFIAVGASVFAVLTAAVADAFSGLDESGRGSRTGAIIGGAAFGAAFGAGVGAVAGGLASGWEQRYPSRLDPRSWTQPVFGASGPLRVDLRLGAAVLARGDSVRAYLTWTNASDDTLEVLERACGPLLVVLLPGGREHFGSAACAEGLVVVRLAPGTRTAEVWLRADLPEGTFPVEHRTFLLARDRRFPLDVQGAGRLVARAGIEVR